MNPDSYDIEAEKAVMRAVIHNFDLVERYLPHLSAADFSLDYLRFPFEAATTLRAENAEVDPVEIYQWVEQHRRFRDPSIEEGSMMEAMTAPAVKPTAAFIAGQVDLVKRLSQTRECQSLLAKAQDMQPGLLVREVLAIAERVRGQTWVNPKAKGFSTSRVDELPDGEGAHDFVENLFTEGGTSVVYGPSNCGKSFWILDLAVHVATGQAWRDGEHEVDQGAVVYFALEGSHGFRHRIKALQLEGKLTEGAPLHVSFEQVSLLEHGNSTQLVETVKAVQEREELPVRLVIFDTLARAMAGGDENAGQDMTAAVKTMDAVRAATGAHVCLIHHCGKDEARGARGHSSLRAAVDTEIEVSRPEGEGISTAKVTKQRDLEKCGPMPFSLRSVTVGTNRRGKGVTSCVLKQEDEMMASAPKKGGRPSKCTPLKMLEYLPCPSAKEWQARVESETGLGKSQFYDNKRELESKRLFRFNPITQELEAA